MVGKRAKSWVTEDDFGVTFGGRIATIGGVHVDVEFFANDGQVSKECQGEFFGQFRDAEVGFWKNVAMVLAMISVTKGIFDA